MTGTPPRSLELTAPVLIAAVTAEVVLLYADTFLAMATHWQHADYHRGALVLPMAAFLVWRARADVAGAHLAPWAPGLIVLVGLVASWCVARLLNIGIGEHLAVLGAASWFIWPVGCLLLWLLHRHQRAPAGTAAVLGRALAAYSQPAAIVVIAAAAPGPLWSSLMGDASAVGSDVEVDVAASP